MIDVGTGTAIQRELAAWPRIEFRNDHDGGRFVATVRRDDEGASDDLTDSVTIPKRIDPVDPRDLSPTVSEKMTEKSPGRILDLLTLDSHLTIADLSMSLDVSARTIERNLSALQESGRLRRIGPDKGGRWEVVS